MPSAAAVDVYKRQALSIAIAAGLAVSRLARLVRLPNVTAFLVGGLIIGPSVLGILPRDMLDGFSVITEAALGLSLIHI